MIESRYSIEYVDPNSPEEKPALVKFLIYTLLLCSIALVIAAVAFSFSENTASLITQKIEAFNSEPEPEENDNKAVIAAPAVAPPATISNQAEIDKITLQLNTKLKEQIQASAQREKQYKQELAALLEEKNKQSALAKQQSKNISSNKKTQTSKLETIAKQIEDEKQRNTKLKQEIEALTLENKVLSGLLDNTEIQLNGTQSAKSIPAKTSKKPVATLEKPKQVALKVTPPAKVSPVPVSIPEKITSDKPIPDKPAPAKVVVSPSKDAQKSVDAIIESMNKTAQQEAPKEEPTHKVKTANDNDLTSKSEAVKTVTDKATDNTTNDNTDQKPVAVTSKAPEEKTSVQPVTNVESSKNEAKPSETREEPSKSPPVANTSAVDAIVAAMQQQPSAPVARKATKPKIQIETKPEAKPETKIKTAEPAKQTTANTEKPQTLIVKKGETIWGLAERAYGNGVHYKKIIEANPKVNIKRLLEGQVLIIPKLANN